MKIFKTLSILAAIWALLGVPGFFNTLPAALNYRIEYAFLVFGHVLTELCIVTGSMLALKEKMNIAQWLLIFGCVFSAYGRITEGYHYHYPHYFSYKFNFFYGEKELQNGFSIDLPFAALAALMFYHWPTQPIHRKP
ncbi:MAG: hypothetical protein AAF546_03785 [Verrucomicrobiota bacterium]